MPPTTVPQFYFAINESSVCLLITKNIILDHGLKVETPPPPPPGYFCRPYCFEPYYVPSYHCLHYEYHHSAVIKNRTTYTYSTCTGAAPVYYCLVLFRHGAPSVITRKSTQHTQDYSPMSDYYWTSVTGADHFFYFRAV